MKYYAVTEDPRELFHYGVKGMKWGQHLFGDDLKPKSAAYKRAARKLRASAKKAGRTTVKAAKVAKNVVKNGATQLAYNARRLQDNRYQKAIQKAQKRTNLTQALYALDKENTFRKHLDYDRKREALADKITNVQDYNAYKSMKKAVRIEKKMPKYMQEAREGTLKYGKLSEDQISRIQDRLAAEQNARRLGNTEFPKFRTRLKRATQEGILQGTAKGIAAGMEEVARAKVQNRYANKRVLDKQNVNRAQREHEAKRVRDDKTAKEIRQDVKTEAYEAQIRSGMSWNDRTWGKHMAVARGAREINRINDEKREHQQKLEDARQEKQFLEAAKSAYEYGFVPAYLNNGTSVVKEKKLDAGSNNGGGQNQNNNNNGGGKKKNKGGGGGKNIGDIDNLAEYYEARVVKQQTKQAKKEKKDKQQEDKEYFEQLRKQVQENAERKAEEQRRNEAARKAQYESLIELQQHNAEVNAVRQEERRRAKEIRQVRQRIMNGYYAMPRKKPTNRGVRAEDLFISKG